jgi:hypothetical protein
VLGAHVDGIAEPAPRAMLRAWNHQLVTLQRSTCLADRSLSDATD